MVESISSIGIGGAKKVNEMMGGVTHVK